MHVWRTFLGVNLNFSPMHLVGAAGMPRRYIDYPNAYAGWNELISIGSYLGAVARDWGLGVFVYTLMAGRRVSEPND